MIPPFDLDQAYALSTEAGWNQTKEDWKRLVDLAPSSSFGVHHEGRLIATGVALIYSRRLAWIGMVITKQEHRGQGHARRLLERCIDECDQRGVECVKLDATELGRPVYHKLGFVDERPISRWWRNGGAKPQMRPLRSWLDLSLDLEAFGADRSALLNRLAEHELYGVEGRGYAFARPGRMAWHFGPCVSRDSSTAERLLAAFLASHGGEPSILDLCDDHGDAARIARAAGYQPVRYLTRMYRGDPSGAQLASGPLVYNLGAFEYG
jgi:GNAT superfamily N-acetyltransferase